MSKVAYRVAGLSLASVMACSFAGLADAQLLARKDLSLAAASAIAQGAIAACKSQGYSISVHVVGREGQVIVAVRGDGAGLNTMENSMKKAYTARTLRQPSANLAKNAKSNPTAGALFLTNIVAAQGALPIMDGQDVIGAVGVSGAPGGDKDEVCAKAGIDKADLK